MRYMEVWRLWRKGDLYVWRGWRGARVPCRSGNKGFARCPQEFLD